MNSKFSSTNGLEVVSLFFIENLRSLTFICCLLSLVFSTDSCVLLDKNILFEPAQ